ncbi:hypothetical protein CDL12_19657 [Handroanthus impetiginosus]|uniref:Uncharacterized protein n=1 Tax=Handroanthus impetiginosus TaxID=429701 RepID=A0A2G9GR57_9LAMI|nr:hypothetical protein CDL12_19657 [Handroanthus impetiginosus]
MATGWMKSLQCKSKALDDVVYHHHHRRHKHHSNPKNQLHQHQREQPLSQSSSCKSSVQSLKDIVETTKQSKPKKPKPPKPPQTPPFRRPVSRKPDSGSHQVPTIRPWSSSAESFFPSLTELPEGHPSRNVVEIIFHSSWGEKSFSGQIEMVFKVQNLTRTVTRFEEYREMVKSQVSSKDVGDGGEDYARCVADGNDVMRFYCLGATSGGGAYEAGCGAWALYGGKGAVVCTFSGSGCAHENAGGGRGRRAMLVCRVIAGRFGKKKHGFDSLFENRVGYDSVSGENGELLVFDSRALLPCFLIIYKL